LSYLHEVFLTQMLSFATNTNLGCHIYADKKFTNVFVKAFTKSNTTRLRFCKSNYRLKNFYATASLIFHS